MIISQDATNAKEPGKDEQVGLEAQGDGFRRGI